MATVNIQVPDSSITFDLSGHKFTVSLADTSRGKLSEVYRKIQLNDMRRAQHQKLLGTQFTQQLAELDAKTADVATEADRLKKQYQLQNSFERKMQTTYDKQEDEDRTAYQQLFDTMFGDGSGKQIYLLSNQSTVVMGKIMGMVMAEVGRRTDVLDYQQKYLRKIDEMKNGHTDEAPDQSQV
ncbi:hypothetical protein [Schleiferilactobacillus harbinensis]|uniref:Uncharacterized protein n=1 Tax=Schleiferilactobacillus harbinensis TaxID=304207 RepID=A0A5P8M791_9LACO|nr:hypothetical protein [Schleiferilactobacillus harbinensis]QFR24085.1 hypothetical protein D1010_12210 [Schleiferilactobacillus harbinensis]